MEEILNAIKWHHLAFPFALVFIIFFKQPLTNLITRVTSIDKKGLKVGPSPESQREKTETTNETVQQLLNLVGNSIVINEKEEIIKKELEETGLSTDGDAVKVLIKHLVGTQLLLAFEQVYSSIFGSQIVLLKKLNEVKGQGMNEELVNKHIETAKNSYPVELGNWAADEYLWFLRSYLLIVNIGDQIHITNLGVEYLTWMARNGYSENKVL